VNDASHGVYICPRCSGLLLLEARGVRCRECSSFYPEEDGILHLVTGRSAAPGYDPHYFESLPGVEDEHFWFVSRREIILEALRRCVPDLSVRPLCDVGCGSGGLLAFLAASGVPVAGGCDAYLQALRGAKARLGKPFALVDEGFLPPLRPGQRLLGLFDVLEHLDEDQAVLGRIASSLEPGGVLILTVPGHPFLFDEMDTLACHRRRYSRRDLRRKLEEAGLEIRLLTHFMAPLVPMLIALRRVGRLFPAWWGSAKARRDAELRIVPALNGPLRSLLRLERHMTRLGSLPFGTSILAVAARPLLAPTR
jgi:SAM-dependent methyltransferase